MTNSDYEKLFVATQKALKSYFGSMGDLPYEFADAVANVYWRGFEQGLDSPPEISFEEMQTRRVEFDAMPGLVDGIRQMQRAGYSDGDVKAVAFCYVNTCKYRMDNAETKTPIRCMIERRFRRHQDIPNLVRALGVYD